jgi:hypothetical protein
MASKVPQGDARSAHSWKSNYLFGSDVFRTMVVSNSGSVSDLTEIVTRLPPDKNKSFASDVAVKMAFRLAASNPENSSPS